MTIKNVLQAKGSTVATISPDATLTELVDTLAEHRIGAMVVSADGTHIDGIVSERDIVRALRSDGGLPSFRESRLIQLDRVTVSRDHDREVMTCTPGHLDRRGDDHHDRRAHPARPGRRRATRWSGS